MYGSVVMSYQAVILRKQSTKSFTGADTEKRFVCCKTTTIFVQAACPELNPINH